MINFFLSCINIDVKFVLLSVTTCRRIKNIGCISNRKFKRRINNEHKVSDSKKKS